MACRIISVHAGIHGMGIYAIMVPSSGFSVAHCPKDRRVSWKIECKIGPVGELASGEINNQEVIVGSLTCHCYIYPDRQGPKQSVHLD